LRKAGGRVVAAVDQDARRFALPELAGIEGCRSLEEALGRFPDAPVVDICTPPASHLALVLESLAAGRHVLCEKPFVLDSSEAAQVLAAAREQGRMVVVMHNWIGAPVFRELMTKIGSGRLGEVVAVNATFITGNGSDIMGIADESHWVHRLPAGRLQETLPHVVYTLLALLGSVDVQIEAVRTQKTTAFPWVKEDALVLVLRSGRRLVTALLGMSMEESLSKIEVIGSKRAAEARFFVELLEGVSLAHEMPAGRGLLSRGHRLGSGAFVRLATLGRRATAVVSGKIVAGDLWVMQEFLAAVEGRGKPPVSIEEAVATVTLTEAIVDEILAQRALVEKAAAGS
jgi:predicted dehydrogenase